MIRLGLPKGRMAGDSERFCAALGVRLRAGVLSYQTVLAGTQISVHLLKAPDVARLLRRNLLDLGLAGDEWLMETDISPDRRCFEVRSYEAAVCLLMTHNDPRPPERIRLVVSPYPHLARRLLRETAPAAEVMAVSGSSEALVPGIADASVDLVETGTSAALNSLTVRQSFTYVTTHLVRSEGCDSTAAAPVVELLQSAMDVVR